MLSAVAKDLSTAAGVALSAVLAPGPVVAGARIGSVVVSVVVRFYAATASQRAVVRLVRAASADPRALFASRGPGGAAGGAGALVYPSYAVAGVSLFAPPTTSVRDVVVVSDFAALPTLGFRLWLGDELGKVAVRASGDPSVNGENATLYNDTLAAAAEAAAGVNATAMMAVINPYARQIEESFARVAGAGLLPGGAGALTAGRWPIHSSTTKQSNPPRLFSRAFARCTSLSPPMYLTVFTASPRAYHRGRASASYC